MKKEAESENAVSTVVMMMVLLAIILIFLTVFMNVYIPQTKEAAEIMHSDDVKDTFLKITSDINQIYSANMIGIISESVPLGGGDVLFSTAKSAGYLSVEEDWLQQNGERVWVNISYVEDDIPKEEKLCLKTINITYKPVFTNWENQWYKYKNGVVWVHKNNDRKTPLNTFTIRDGNNLEIKTVDSWIQQMKPRSLYTLQSVSIPEFVLTEDATNYSVTLFDGYNYEGESVYTMNVVDFRTENTFEHTSGTGNANLYIITDTETFTYNLTGVDDAVTIAEINQPLAGNGKRTLILNKITATVSIR